MNFLFVTQGPCPYIVIYIYIYLCMYIYIYIDIYSNVAIFMQRCSCRVFILQSDLCGLVRDCKCDIYIYNCCSIMRDCVPA